jgi:hypothetical protein
MERTLADKYFRQLLSRRLDVLVEGADPQRPGLVRGTSCRYAPVAFEGYAPALVARRVPVRAQHVMDGLIIACGDPETSFDGVSRPAPESAPLETYPKMGQTPCGSVILVDLFRRREGSDPFSHNLVIGARMPLPQVELQDRVKSGHRSAK